ncbi:MAG: hypothetical protein H0V82_07355 [Candidatus Protochlamydia sp.]|nr:hypothetical protein [Candidatus Protochlamydia sp.]
MNEYVKAFILHYSDIHDQEVSKMVRSQIVPSDIDAKRLISFIDVIFKYSTQDMEEGKVILGESANNYDAEKAGMAILEILRANNFNSLVNKWS